MFEHSFNKIYYLGPEGSNSHNAMLQFINTENIIVNNKIPLKSIKTVLETLENDTNSVAILPIENSIEGIVRETIDNIVKLQDKSIKIQGELTIPIKHCMLSTGKDKNEITKIISHPQALSQCGNYIYKNYNSAQLVEVSSTSYAAKKIFEDNNPHQAAIANEACAVLFNLNILEHDINDEHDNKTRFYILSRSPISAVTSGKTAIILSTKNKPGALCDVLKIFSKHDINLTYIDSRPSKKKLGEYLFFMELDCIETDEKVKAALNELSEFVNFMKILGSFKIYK